jgi:hypothetical protein
MEHEVHFPEGSEGAAAAAAAEKAAAEAEAKATEEKAAAEAAAADEAKAKEAEAAAAAKAKAEDEAQHLTKKPRSIYDDYKEEKGKRKTAEEQAEAQKARADALEAELANARGGEPAADASPKKPDDPPADELEAFAKEKGYDAAELARLSEIISKRVPASQLSAEERKTLDDLTAYKTAAEANEQRRQEDQAILAEAPAVKKQLSIERDEDLSAVMAEITRLAHTAEFSDKEVSYIAWKKSADLSKLISPMKPSFESGDQGTDAAPESEPDLTKGGVTPEMAQRAQTRTKSALEVRKSN